MLAVQHDPDRRVGPGPGQVAGEDLDLVDRQLAGRVLASLLLVDLFGASLAYSCKS